MIIHYKSITHERMEDAPFIGALICAIDCRFNCEGCFNQSLKQPPTIADTAENIISEVKSNPFNQGIILAGLEWSLQAREAKELITISLAYGLEVILYTGLDFTEFKTHFSELIIDGIYVKCGRYCSDLSGKYHREYGVILSSDNQHIYKINNSEANEINGYLEGEDINRAEDYFKHR